MANFELSATGHLSANPAQVWAHLVDQDATPCWLEGVSSVVMDGDQLMVHLGGDLGPGWITGEVVSASVTRDALTGEVVPQPSLRAEPRERLELRLEAPAANLAEARVEIVLHEDEAGTIYELNVTGLPSLFGSLMTPLLRLRTEVAMARAVRGFRASLDARGHRKARPFDGPCPERAEPRLEIAAAVAG